jgi:hypothetical protein
MRPECASKKLRKEWMATKYVNGNSGRSVIGGQWEMTVGKIQRPNQKRIAIGIDTLLSDDRQPGFLSTLGT